MFMFFFFFFFMFMYFYVTRWLCYVVEIFLTKLLAVFLKSNFFSLIIWFKVNFIHFSYAFALDSLKISSVLNSRLPGLQWRARSHIVLEYNIENMRFIRLLLLSQSNRLYFFALMILYDILHIICILCALSFVAAFEWG